MASVAACGGDDSGEMVEPVDASGQPIASCDPSIPAFTIGAGGLTDDNAMTNVRVRVEDADYLPPRNGINSWTVAITDLNDQPIPEAQLTWVCAHMPAHNHGSNPKVVSKLDEKHYSLERQNLSMQGGWEIRFWIDRDGGSEEFKGAVGGINNTACGGPDGNSTWTNSMRICVPRKDDAI